VASHSLTLLLARSHTHPLSGAHVCCTLVFTTACLPISIPPADRKSISSQAKNEVWLLLNFLAYTHLRESGAAASKNTFLHICVCKLMGSPDKSSCKKWKALKKIDVDWCKIGDASGFRFKGKASNLTKAKFVGVTSYVWQPLLLLLQWRGKINLETKFFFQMEIEIMSHQFVTTGYKLVISLLRFPLYTKQIFTLYFLLTLQASISITRELF
jgi:hypothetical protein